MHQIVDFCNISFTDAKLLRHLFALHSFDAMFFFHQTYFFGRFSSCHDLVLSRFCAADYKDYGILGIKIHRITRVHNRMLRSRFDAAFSSHVDDDDSPFFVPK